MGLCQKKTSENEEDKEIGNGQKWIWTAIDATSRLIVCYRVGGHELDDARCFLTNLVNRLTKKPLFTSDELAHYASILEELFHTTEVIPPTGQRGRPRLPKRVIDSDLDYATVKKTRKGGVIVKVEREIVFGTPESIASRLDKSPSLTINTAYVERSNLDWRMWDAHLSRKSLQFAKCEAWLKAKFAICIMAYNFIRPHASLSRRKERPPQPTTPAMAAKLVSRPLTFDEIIGLSTDGQ